MTAEKRTRSPFKEYMRFGIAGAMNTGTDFLILNFLLVAFGPAIEHPAYILCKIVSFTAAVAQSYLLNKHWVFLSSGDKGKIADIEEGGKFLAVSALGFLINIMSSSLIFSVLVAGSIDDRLAGNLGAMVGTMLVILWNYAGYKFFVFKQSKSV